MSDKFTISNAFNHYFVKIGHQLEGAINTTINPLTYVKSSINSIFMPYVNENEITEIVYKLNLKRVVHTGIQLPPLSQRAPFSLTLNL